MDLLHLPQGGTATISALILGLVVLYRFVLTRVFGPPTYPPAIPHLLPWFGALFRVIWDPYVYLSKTSARWGPNFRVRVAGRTILVVGTPAAIRNLQDIPSETFLNVTHEIYRRLVGLPGADGKSNTVRSIFLPGIADGFPSAFVPAVTGSTARLLEGRMMHIVSDSSEYHSVDISDFVTRIVYTVSSATLWGGGTDMEGTFDDFMAFDKAAFSLTFHLPFSGSGANHRSRLLSTIEAHIRDNWVGGSAGADLDGHLRGAAEPLTECIRRLKKDESMTESDVAKAMLIVHWGIQGSIVGVATWLMIFLTANPYAFLRVRDAVRDASAQTRVSAGGTSPLGPELLSEFPLLDSAIKETIRLILLPTAVYKACSNFSLPLDGMGERAIPVKTGEYVFFDVANANLNSRIYSSPRAFVPERFLCERELRRLQTTPKSCTNTSENGYDHGAKHLVPWELDLFLGSEYVHRIVKLYFILFFQNYDVVQWGYSPPLSAPRSFARLQPLVTPNIEVRLRRDA